MINSNYSIVSDNTVFSEDWDSIKVTISRDSSIGPNYAVFAVSGEANPLIWNNQYKPSVIEALGGNGNSRIAFTSQELSYSPETYNSSGNSSTSPTRVIGVNSNGSVGADFVYHLNLTGLNVNGNGMSQWQNVLQITKVFTLTGEVDHTFASNGKLSLNTSTGSFTSSNAPEVVVDGSGNLYIAYSPGATSNFSATGGLYKFNNNGQSINGFQSPIDPSNANLLGVSGDNLYYVTSDQILRAVNTGNGTGGPVSSAPSIPFNSNNGATDNTNSGMAQTVLTQDGSVVFINGSNYQSYNLNTNAHLTKDISTILNISNASSAERFLSKAGDLYLLDENTDKVWMVDSPSSIATSYQIDLSTLSPKFALPSTTGAAAGSSVINPTNTNWQFQGVGDDGSVFLRAAGNNGWAATDGPKPPDTVFVKFTPNANGTALILDTSWGINGFVYDDATFDSSRGQILGVVDNALIAATSMKDGDFNLSGTNGPSFLGRDEATGDDYYKVNFNAAVGPFAPGTAPAGTGLNTEFRLEAKPDAVVEGDESIVVRLVTPEVAYAKFGNMNGLGSADTYTIVNSQARININLTDATPVYSSPGVDLNWRNSGPVQDVRGPFTYSDASWTTTGYQRDSISNLWSAQVHQPGGIPQLRVSLDQSQINQVIGSAANNANPVLSIGSLNRDQATGEYSTTNANNNTSLQIKLSSLIADATAGKTALINTWDDLGNSIEVIASLQTRRQVAQGSTPTKDFVDVLISSADGTPMSDSQAESLLRRIGVGLMPTGNVGGPGYVAPITLPTVTNQDGDGFSRPEQGTVSFNVASPLMMGQSITIGGLTFTASSASVNSTDLANAFANLTPGQSTPPPNSFGFFSGSLSDWYSSPNNGGIVVFTGTVGNTNIGDLTVTSSSGGNLSSSPLTPFNEAIDLVVNIKNPVTGAWEGAINSTQTDTSSFGLYYNPQRPFDAYFHDNVIELGFQKVINNNGWTVDLPKTVPWLSDGTDWQSWQGNPSTSNFQVSVNGQAVNVKEAVMQGGLTLIVDQDIDKTASVAISYTNSTTTNQIWHVLQDQQGTDVPSFTMNASYSNPPLGITVLSGAQFGWNTVGGHEDQDYFGKNYSLGSSSPVIEGAISGGKQTILVEGPATLNPNFDADSGSTFPLAAYEYVVPQLKIEFDQASYNGLKLFLGRIPTLGDLLASSDLLVNSFQWNALATHSPDGASTTFELAKHSIPNGLPISALAGGHLGAPLSDQMSITGGIYDDVLTAMFGNQTLNGGAGDDWLYGGPGIDILNGGIGNDTVIYQGSQSDYTITPLSAGRYTVTHHPQTGITTEAPSVSTVTGTSATHERATVTFNDLDAGQSVTVNGLTYTVNSDVSRTVVADAFMGRGAGVHFSNMTWGEGVLNGTMGPNFGSNNKVTDNSVQFTASFMGDINDIQVSGGSNFISALLIDGTDTLYGVEHIEFADRTIDLSVPQDPVLSLAASVNPTTGAITVDAGWVGTLENINYSVGAVGASYSSSSFDVLPGDGENSTYFYTDNEINVGVYSTDVIGSIAGDGIFSQTVFMPNGGVRDVTISMRNIAVDPVGDEPDLPVEIPATVTLAMGASLAVAGNPTLNVTEGSTSTTPQTVTINVALDRQILTNQTLSWSVAGNAINGTDAVSGTDFVGGALPTGTLTLLAGATTGQITFQIAGDNAIERTEGYQIMLSGSSGLDLSGIGPLTGTIANDDYATISISALSTKALEGNSGSTPYEMTIALDQVALEAQSVNWAVELLSGAGNASATDFAGLLNGSVTFAAGETSKTITLNVAGDTLKEGNESFNVRLSNVVGDATIKNGVLNAAIKDDDGFDVDGHVYFWGGGVASKQFVMDDVDVSVQQLLAGSVQTLVDTPIKMQNIKLNTDSHLATADLWLEHTDVSSFSFTSSTSVPAGAVFTKSLSSSWNVVQTTDANGLLHVSGNYTGAAGTQTLDTMKIGVMSFATPEEDASPLSFKLLDGSVSNDAGFSKTISPVEAKITFADTTDVTSPGDMLDGQYTLGTLTEGFYGIDADRDFVLSTKDANGFDIWSNEAKAITAADAREALLISLGKQVSAHELIAADVNGSGTVTAADARDILLMSVKNTTKLAALDWKFVDEDADLSALTKNNVKEGVAWKQGADVSVTGDSSYNLVGILMGDLNASYTPDYAKVTPDQAHIW